MSKTLRLILSAVLFACLALPLTACAGTSTTQEVAPASEGPSFTSADLVGTVWHASGDGGKEDFGFWFEFPSEERCYLMWVVFGGIDGVAGFDYSVHGRALVQDGRQTGTIAEDFSQIELTFPDGSMHVFVPDDRQLTSQEDFEDMLTYLDPLFNADGTRFKTFVGSDGSASAGANASQDSDYDDQVVTAAGIRVVMPGKWAAKGLYWAVDERFQLMRLEYPLNGDRVQIAEIDWGERASLPYECDDELWTLGNVYVNGVARPAVLHIAYVDSEGKVYSANISVPDATLASEYFLGLSPEEIISWIQISEGSQSGASSSGLSTRRGEFCGVWAYASKDLGEAVDFADGARSRGFSAEVFLTTDWSNLNTEPWYVVSLGCCASEAEAERLLQSAHESVYGDAYIKWSGDYIGAVSSAQSASSSGLSTRSSEFCGVWAYASKDLGEAVDFADGARSRGFSAEVFLTTDWSNLNTEPWYVVSLGCTGSEAEADRVLQSAHESVYGDAYLKWSGDYIG